MDDQQFRQLLDRFEFSWSGYRKVRKGVKKRISRHMNTLGCGSFTDYQTELDKNKEIRHQCELLLTVSISRFFRDRKFWQTLENRFLPDLCQKYRDNLKIWSAGCACGEEVYSFKIIWDCLQQRLVNLPDLEFLATDMNPIYIDKGRVGIYSYSSLKEVKKEYQSKYFEQKTGKNLYQIKASIKNNIDWKIHHLLADPLGSDFHIIFLRNSVLTYYEKRLKKLALKNVLKSLAHSGLLVIGTHETLPFETSGLTSVEPFSFVFRKG